MDISIIINKLSSYEKKDNLEIIKNFSKFEKRIYNEIKQYDDKSGLTDYRMNIYDYYILLILYENSNKYYECGYKNGIRDGKGICYYENGKHEKKHLSKQTGFDHEST